MFIVIAGKYDDEGPNCKYSSEPHSTLEKAIEDLDRVSGYPWSYIEFNGRILDVCHKDFHPLHH